MTDAERREAARQFYQKWVGKGKEDEEVVPADFGRLTYTDFYEDAGFDDNFVFNDFEEEQEDDNAREEMNSDANNNEDDEEQIVETSEKNETQVNNTNAI